MKVLYDISVLGLGHFVDKVRTGVFRVVEKGATALLNSALCDVAFCASDKNFSQCEKFLSDVHGLNIRIRRPEDVISRVYESVQPARYHVHAGGKHFLKNNLVRYLYHYGEQYVKTLSINDIRSSDIYHSPVRPIPSDIMSEKGINKFITIHDIIPLVYDDYVSRLSAESMTSIVSSIDKNTHVLCVSNHTRYDLLNYTKNIDHNKVHVIHLAADDRFYKSDNPAAVSYIYGKYNIPADKKYLLTLSTFMPRKNFPRTIRCFVNLLKETKIKDLCLVVVGAVEWDYEEILYAVEQAKEFRKNIIIAGYVPDEDLAPLYSGATAFLYLSMYEGFGLPPLEAMQCGTAVITSNRSSLPEVVGDAGIMVDPLDDEAICSAMLEVYSSSTLRERLERMSLDRAKMFSWEKYGSQMIAAYHQADLMK